MGIVVRPWYKDHGDLVLLNFFFYMPDLNYFLGVKINLPNVEFILQAES